MKSNPLSTRFVAPGKLGWHPPPGESLVGLTARFTKQLGYRAAIVGPHGSGKSSLLEHLVPLLGQVVLRRSTYVHAGQQQPGDAERGTSDPMARQVTWLQLRGRPASRRLVWTTRQWWTRPNSLLVIDGYEQLSRVARGYVLAATRASGTGLLITSHTATWLPTLLETRVDVGVAQSLLDELLPSGAAARQRLVDAHRLKRLLHKHRGNLREVFMELYDELEQQQVEQHQVEQHQVERQSGY